MSERMQQLEDWVGTILAGESYKIAPASEDASFRRYFRISSTNETYIVMDAPPDKEDCTSFLDVNERLTACGVNVPEVFARDLEQGFILLGDLGSELYLDRIDETNADALYADAMSALVQFQKGADVSGLPPYDESLLLSEMQLFQDWLLGKHLRLSLTQAEQEQLGRCFNYLAASALAQPRVFVHRDFHSRNLMVQPRNPGIIDFQDAVLGPFTYDLVSLLKDCYIKWPAERVETWLASFYQEIAGANNDVSIEQFRAWFDLMGVQRHLKASGIFARLCHRDAKPTFLDDIPRTLSYIVDLQAIYPELGFLAGLLHEKVLPGLAKT